MRGASALAEQELPRKRGSDSHAPSRADGHSRATRQRFWPADAQPEAAEPLHADRGLLYTWRRQIQEGMAAHRSSPDVSDARQTREAPQPATLKDNRGRLVDRRLAQGVIEIDLPNGVCVRVDNQVDPVALRRVLDALLLS